MAQLIMRRGPEPGRVYPLNKRVIQIGRGRRNDIIIEDNEVSREHCRLVQSESAYALYDLDSVNGTFVNGQRVTEDWSLKSDSIIELGDSITLEYKLGNKRSLDPNAVTRLLHEDQQAFFVVTSSTQSGRAIYPLDGEKIHVGRGTDNDVIIVEPEISRQHMRLTRHGGLYYIQDLGSTNGTMLNGVEISEMVPLHPGDIIRVGTGIVIQYTTDPEDVPHVRIGTDELPADAMDATRQRRDITSMFTTAIPSPVLTNRPESAIGDLTTHILLMYDRSDWEQTVAALVTALYDSDVQVWVDQYLTPGEEEWRAAIEQARFECRMLVVLVTPKSLELPHLRHIWRYFNNRDKPVVLAIAEPVDQLPMGADRATRVPFERTHLDDSITRLIQTIKRIQP